MLSEIKSKNTNFTITHPCLLKVQTSFRFSDRSISNFLFPIVLFLLCNFSFFSTIPLPSNFSLSSNLRFLAARRDAPCKPGSCSVVAFFTGFHQKRVGLASSLFVIEASSCRKPLAALPRNTDCFIFHLRRRSLLLQRVSVNTCIRYSH